MTPSRTKKKNLQFIQYHPSSPNSLPNLVFLLMATIGMSQLRQHNEHSTCPEMQGCGLIEIFIEFPQCSLSYLCFFHYINYMDENRNIDAKSLFHRRCPEADLMLERRKDVIKSKDIT
jgi:hypothetical protein